MKLFAGLCAKIFSGFVFLLGLSQAKSRFADICGRPLVEPTLWPKYIGNAAPLRQKRFISNGNDASDGSFPYFARVIPIPGDIYGCGAGIISDQWVITADHCVDENSTRFVYTGIHEWNKHTEQMLVSEKLVFHPNVSRSSWKAEWDVALVKLNGTIVFNDYVKPICLSRDTSFLTKDYPVMLPGLGYDADKKIPSVTQEALLYFAELIDHKVEAANIEQGNAREGDSGSPMYSKHNGLWYQVAVFAGGGQASAAGTSISAVCDWINDVTGEELCT
ncbi:unnamed protein product, partial [Mesorhabditis belari]|uniref:Peptidase S1 domain-containing protein n=1 Tax=Mesorhabditis belari TaxID=2138241 RepID=A0AAF3E8K5_9BILA